MSPCQETLTNERVEQNDSTSSNTQPESESDVNNKKFSIALKKLSQLEQQLLPLTQIQIKEIKNILQEWDDLADDGAWLPLANIDGCPLHGARMTIFRWETLTQCTHNNRAQSSQVDSGLLQSSSNNQDKQETPASLTTIHGSLSSISDSINSTHISSNSTSNTSSESSNDSQISFKWCLLAEIFRSDAGHLELIPYLSGNGWKNSSDVGKALCCDYHSENWFKDAKQLESQYEESEENKSFEITLRGHSHRIPSDRSWFIARNVRLNSGKEPTFDHVCEALANDKKIQKEIYSKNEEIIAQLNIIEQENVQHRPTRPLFQFYQWHHYGVKMSDDGTVNWCDKSKPSTLRTFQTLAECIVRNDSRLYEARKNAEVLEEDNIHPHIWNSLC